MHNRASVGRGVSALGGVILALSIGACRQDPEKASRDAILADLDRSREERLAYERLSTLVGMMREVDVQRASLTFRVDTVAKDGSRQFTLAVGAEERAVIPGLEPFLAIVCIPGASPIIRAYLGAPIRVRPDDHSIPAASIALNGDTTNTGGWIADRHLIDDDAISPSYDVPLLRAIGRGDTLTIAFTAQTGRAGRATFLLARAKEACAALVAGCGLAKSVPGLE